MRTSVEKSAAWMEVMRASVTSMSSSLPSIRRVSRCGRHIATTVARTSESRRANQSDRTFVASRRKSTSSQGLRSSRLASEGILSAIRHSSSAKHV